MSSYYEKKIVEVQTEVQQASHYSKIDIEEWTISQQTLQIDYEKVQKSYYHEKEVTTSLEASYCKSSRTSQRRDHSVSS